MIVYKTSNLVNSKSYIGQDSNNDPDYLGSGRYLRSAIQQHGRKNFKKEIIAWCDTKDKLNFLERFFIDFFKTKVPNGYNISDGGDGGNLGSLVNEKIRKAMRGTSWNKGNKGGHLSLETRKKMSERKRGIPMSLEAREKISKGLKGRKTPWLMGDLNPAKRPEVRKKLSGENNVAKRPEVREKISATMKGRHLSEEHKRNLSISRRMIKVSVIGWMILFLFSSLASCSVSKAKVIDNQPAIEEQIIDSIHDPRISSLAYGLKRAVRAEVNYYWGLEQRATVFYSQIHQESGWNPDAKSQYASGLAQFTPDTAKWISKLYPVDLGENNPLDARWAIRACVKYDRWIYDKLSEVYQERQRWAMTLSSYNGGKGWLDRDRKLCFDAPCCCDQMKWFENVEMFSNRAAWAIKENRDYVVKILDRWSPMYEKAGFI